jgi:four helix bundle protein
MQPSPTPTLICIKKEEEEEKEKAIYRTRKTLFSGFRVIIGETFLSHHQRPAVFCEAGLVVRRRKGVKMNNNAKSGKERVLGFSFENLDVYPLIVEYLELVQTIYPTFPKGSANLRDQLQRASESILLNLAEGSGRQRYSPDRKRFNRTAAASGAECAAAWEIIRIRKIAAVTITERARQLLKSIVSMLTRMSS